MPSPRRKAAQKPASTPVRVFTLGRFRVEVDGVALGFRRKTQRKPLDLLKVLIAFGGESVSAEQLTEALWSEADGDAAYNALRTTVSRLRKLIGAEAVQGQDGRWSLNSHVCWVDAHTITSLLREALRDGDTNKEEFCRRLEEALALYQGPFLDGEFHLPPVLSARQRLHSLILRHVAEVGTLYEHAGQRARAIDLYRKGLEVDDLAEEIYQRLMRCFEASGRAAEGIAVFQRCREALRTHVGSEPSPQTRALHHALLAQGTNDLPTLSGPEPAPRATAELAQRTIAVLPFDDMSGSSGQARFADAIGQNIICLLANIPRLSMVARNSSFVYRARDVNVPHVGRELGVRYVLVGSVLISGSRVRVMAQLVDAQTGHYAWADVYDRALDDVIRVQAEIALAMVKALQTKLSTGMLAPLRESDNVNAWEARTLASEYSQRHRREDNRRARELYHLALQLEPDNLRSSIAIGSTHLMDYWFNWSDDPARSIATAERLAREGQPSDAGFGLSHGLLGYIHALKGEHKLALAMADACVEVAPASPIAYGQRGNVLMYAGEIAGGLDALDQALRLHPMPSHWYYKDVGTGNFLLGRYDEAIAALSTVTRRDLASHRDSELLTERLLLVACLQATRQADEARQEAAAILAHRRTFSAAPWCRWYFRPFSNKQPAGELARLLVAAGLPQ